MSQMHIDIRDRASAACPRCESDTYLTLFQAPDRFDTVGGRRSHVVECSDCALIRLDPMPDAAEIASFYPPSYWWAADRSAVGRLAEIYRRLVLMDHVHFVTHDLDRSAPILDVGCGGGSLVHALRRRGLKAFGLDPSGIAAGLAKNSYGLTVTRGILPDAPFAAGTFGAITLCHVLEHVANPMLMLEELAWLLKPGGKLFVQVPNAACWQFLLLGKRWSGLDIPRHLVHFRAVDLEDLLEATGFEVRRRKFFSLRDNPAGLATSIWPALDPAVRRMRGVGENASLRMLKDLGYLALTFAAVPFTLIEAAGAAGSTVMIEAVRPGGA